MPITEPSLDSLRAALQWACQPQNATRIVQGRQQVHDLPRDWVLEHFEHVAGEAIDLSDDWEYRRLLELAQMLDGGLLQRCVHLGLHHPNPDVREAAEDFRRSG